MFFFPGKPAAGWDKTHPDWVPSKFCHTARDRQKEERALERYNRSQFLSKKRKRQEPHCIDLSPEINASSECAWLINPKLSLYLL